MLTHKEVAEVYRIGLTVGLFEVKDVVAWADGVISAEAAPDVAIIEVAMAGDANEGKMAQLLRDVAGDAEGKKTREIVYGLLAKRLASDPDAKESVDAQVKAVEKGEGVHGEAGEDVKKFAARAAEWGR